ncbi:MULTISPECIES: YjbF family lipoprotein [Thioclava]|uniref:YjbF family lipoprotein n=1 Tax=Thioclava kandeliae TaxID=3070818 RepID=A0ABV1SEC3_9RHOB
MKTSVVLSAALLSILAACSSGVEAPNSQEVVARTVVAALKQSRQKPAPQMSRAQLEQLGVPVMEVSVERIGATGYLVPETEQSDSLGRSKTWQSSDNGSFTFRQGVLIASRGFGFDLLSASAPVSKGQAMGPASSASRHYVTRAGDYSENKLDLTCTLGTTGHETIEILGKSHATRHLIEACTSPEGNKVSNDYWIGLQDGVMWQSRQWAGPRMGYVRFRQIVN